MTKAGPIGLGQCKKGDPRAKRPGPALHRHRPAPRFAAWVRGSRLSRQCDEADEAHPSAAHSRPAGQPLARHDVSSGDCPQGGDGVIGAEDIGGRVRPRGIRRASPAHLPGEPRLGPGRRRSGSPGAARRGPAGTRGGTAPAAAELWLSHQGRLSHLVSLPCRSTSTTPKPTSRAMWIRPWLARRW